MLRQFEQVQSGSGGAPTDDRDRRAGAEANLISGEPGYRLIVDTHALSQTGSWGGNTATGDLFWSRERTGSLASNHCGTTVRFALPAAATEEAKTEVAALEG